jgi:hypothetical protein
VRDVSLTEKEEWVAWRLAHERNDLSRARGSRDAHGFAGSSDEGLAIHLLGARAEIAAAKVMDIPFDLRVDTYKAADLGDHVQVKGRSKHDYELLVRPDDPDEHAFILVTCEGGEGSPLRVHGWMWGGEAKQAEWLATHGGRPPAWFVPQSALHDLHELPRAASQPPVRK